MKLVFAMFAVVVGSQMASAQMFGANPPRILFVHSGECIPAENVEGYECVDRSPVPQPTGDKPYKQLTPDKNEEVCCPAADPRG